MNALRIKLACAAAVVALLSGSAVHLPPDVANAAMRGDAQQVESLLRAGADVNAAQGDGMTALHWAAERGDARMTDMLLRAGASVRAFTWIGEYTPLHLASRAGSPEVVKLLLERDSDVKAVTTNSGATSLHFAAASGNAEAVRLLLDAGADVNAREKAWQQTPLMFAASLNRAEVIRVLVERGADPNLRSWFLDGAARASDQAAAAARNEVLTKFREGSEGGVTPAQVQSAITAGRLARLRATGESDFSATADDPNRDPDDPPPNDAITPGGLTALHHAARQGHVDAVRALVEGGADVNRVSGQDNWTPLLIATTNGQWDVAILLIESGANPNTANAAAGIAPLWSTINARWQPRPSFPQPQEQDFQQHGYLEVLEALLVAGADPDAKNLEQPYYLFYGGCGNANCGLTQHSGFTAFFRAGLGADVDAMRLLVKYGADPHVTRTPQAQGGRGGGGGGGAGAGPGAAIAAAAAGRAAAAGASSPPAPVPTAPASAIHAASGLGFGQGVGAGNAIRFMQNGWLPAVRYLVEELGFDVNARDDGGFTPLHFAAARGDHDLIMYLIEKGADVKARSAPDGRNGFSNGYTVADMANGPQPRITPMPATVELLVKLGSENSNNCRSCQ